MVWGKIFEAGVPSILKISPTSDHGFIVYSNGSDGILLLRLDQDGNLLWTRALNKGKFWLQSAAVTSDDGVVLLWNVQSIHPDRRSVLLVRLDSDGNRLWKKQFRVDGIAGQGAAITQTADGNFVLTGVIFLKDKENPDDGFVLRIDPMGKVLAGFRMDNGPYDEANLVLPRSDGGYIVQSNGDDSFLFNVRSDSDLPPCLFRPVKTTRLKFGTLKVSRPDIRTSDWDPLVREETESHSAKFKVHDSPACQ